jgi:hypothetical protein
VSRRRRAAPGEEREQAGAAGPAGDDPSARARRSRQAQAGRTRSARPGSQLAVEVGVLAGVVAVVTVIAELAGAANLGVALGIGTIAFTIVLMYLMLRR